MDTHTAVGDMECLPTTSLPPFEPLVLWTDPDFIPNSEGTEEAHKVEVNAVWICVVFVGVRLMVD